MLDMNFIARSMEAAFGVTLVDIRSTARFQKLVIMRMLLSQFGIERCMISPANVGKFICRDRATVVYHVKKAAELIEYNDAVFMRYHNRLLAFTPLFQRLEELNSKLTTTLHWLHNNPLNPQYETILNDKYQLTTLINETNEALNQLTYK